MFHGRIPIFDIPYGFYRNFFSLCQKNFASIFAKTEFWQKFGWKTKILHFRNDLWVLFIYSSGDHIKFTNLKILLYLFSRVILSSRGEHARNWARGPKTQNFKVLRFKPNFRGRLNMTSEGTTWPHYIKKHLTKLFIHDSSEEHAFPQILSLNHTGSSKFSQMVSKFREVICYKPNTKIAWKLHNKYSTT